MNNTITSFISELGSSDLESLKNVLDAYLESGSPDVMEEGIGFNKNSGYVYIALENGIQIASCFGQSVDFIVYDFETGEEHFFDTYDQAEQFLNK
jgi:hypothetical protein